MPIEEIPGGPGTPGAEGTFWTEVKGLLNGMFSEVYGGLVSTLANLTYFSIEDRKRF